MTPAALILAGLLATQVREERDPLQVSGRYPHLAVFNGQGECGIGAVVPWAGRLWLVTYAPHRPDGSDDRLYEIGEDLSMRIRPESVGGTPAARLVHRESGLLILGPHVIDGSGAVRTIPPKLMPGRLSAAARHPRSPADKVLVYDMEGILYEVDLASLEPKRLFVRALPGWHGKGAYTGQGRLVLANNGEEPVAAMNRFKPFDYRVPFESGGENAGALGEWDGREWRLVERRQFAEVTGPGGIEGEKNAGDPLWALGWDRRSVLLKVLKEGRWSTCRLLKADHSYDGSHGWHTEWPRIREVHPGRYLANMHGGWFQVPEGFAGATGPAPRAIGSHAKITGDFAGWNGRVVFGCDDAAQSTFGAGRSLVGRSQSNLWFASWGDLFRAGRPAGAGGPWLDDDLPAGAVSDPVLVAGYERLVVHLAHGGDRAVRFTLEAREAASDAWRVETEVEVPARGYAWRVLSGDRTSPWIRARVDAAAPGATVYVHAGPGGGRITEPALLEGFSTSGDARPRDRILLKAAGDRDGTLAVVRGGAGWSVDAALRFRRDAAGPEAMPPAPGPGDHPGLEIGADEISPFVVEGARRFRFPGTAEQAGGRLVREAVTERSLLNLAGTFYILPRANSGGVRRLKPLCTHGRRIDDWASWRGLLVLSGLEPGAAPANGHVFRAAEDGPSLWFGDVDDLWRFGKPAGRGGPWKDTPVEPGVPSDPYLMTGYDRKSLELAIVGRDPVDVTLEVDVACDGRWRRLVDLRVEPGRPLRHRFAEGYSAGWIRLTASAACRATAVFAYE